MIIDSHVHYAHPKYNVEIPYLCEQDGEYSVRRADREKLIAEMRSGGIVGFIEPSIGIDEIEKQLSLVSEHDGFMWAALGVHPTRCVGVEWKRRKEIRTLAEKTKIVAIGETGLDYHYKDDKKYRLIQKRWFAYQIKLAHRLKLPLILHVREADGDALGILKKYKSKLHGGVVHCFWRDYETAKKYIELGFVIGVGGKLLCSDAQGEALSDTVKNAPLESLIVETDSPYVFPDMDEKLCKGNQGKKLCNSSLILPSVIRRIAELRGEPVEMIEDAVYRNTVRIFRLNMRGGEENGEK